MGDAAVEGGADPRSIRGGARVVDVGPACAEEPLVQAEAGPVHLHEGRRRGRGTRGRRACRCGAPRAGRRPRAAKSGSMYGMWARAMHPQAVSGSSACRRSAGAASMALLYCLICELVVGELLEILEGVREARADELVGHGDVRWSCGGLLHLRHGCCECPRARCEVGRRTSCESVAAGLTLERRAGARVVWSSAVLLPAGACPGGQQVPPVDCARSSPPRGAGAPVVACAGAGCLPRAIGSRASRTSVRAAGSVLRPGGGRVSAPPRFCAHGPRTGGCVTGPGSGTGKASRSVHRRTSSLPAPPCGTERWPGRAYPRVSAVTDDGLDADADDSTGVVFSPGASASRAQALGALFGALHAVLHLAPAAHVGTRSAASSGAARRSGRDRTRRRRSR